jgi:hypothetical protein
MTSAKGSKEVGDRYRKRNAKHAQKLRNVLSSRSLASESTSGDVEVDTVC